MDQDEQMAIGEQERGPLRHEPQMVQRASRVLSLCMTSLSTLLNPCCSVANRGAAYLAGTSRSVGRGWPQRPPPTPDLLSYQRPP